MRFKGFEKLYGEPPFRLLDTHPDGLHVIMQTDETEWGRSAVWNKKTKNIIWAPKNTHALAWLHNGTQVALLHDPVRLEDYLLTIYTWPNLNPVHQCSFTFPMGWPMYLVVSPKSDLAICQWMDQTEAGFELFQITENGVAHLPKAAYQIEGTNSVTRPIFSSDGRVWVFGVQQSEIWWARDLTEPDPDEPARGGTYDIGTLTIFDLHTDQVKQLPLTATIPGGWLPQSADNEEDWYISDPVFVDAHHVSVRLPTGDTQVLAI